MISAGGNDLVAGGAMDGGSSVEVGTAAPNAPDGASFVVVTAGGKVVVVGDGESISESTESSPSEETDDAADGRSDSTSSSRIWILRLGRNPRPHLRTVRLSGC